MVDSMHAQGHGAAGLRPALYPTALFASLCDSATRRPLPDTIGRGAANCFGIL
jgi:hypothetical protein